MRELFGSVTLALLCACSSGESGIPQSAAADSSATVAGVQASRLGWTGPDDFANLPDRGKLVDYVRPVVRRSGAYTWHAAQLSETHAINAIVSGRMTIQAPDGTPITLRYDRHIEHPEGNWSWIGTTADGSQALITFGANAAFGSIPQGRGKAPLRLTTHDGSAWIVTTDRRRLAAVHNEATDPSGPDYFVPPKLGGFVSQPLEGGAATAPSMAAAAATATGSSRVDLLVGYTQGFAAAVGGQSAARTRIQNLVDLTNQAYINSRIDAQVRLVHAMQVTYPDATDNGEALEALTGFRAPSTQLEPDPAFSALRSAREQYGADLVTLVRKFQTPENGGCGIAWLIGGGMSGISQRDEYFGYSVVSDGQDAGTDGNYYCTDDTLAHELGHNMGSQHDAVTANDEPGLYSYSFGYKTVAGGDFHTVMAYGDSGQQSYLVFSNPDITFCGGHSCGTAAADNARSLRQALPIIAGFRAPVAPPAAGSTGDIDGDGRNDMLWYRPSDGLLAYWIMNGATVARHWGETVGGSWQVIAAGDFDGNGKLDLIWNRPRGDMQYWAGDGNGFAHRQYFTSYPDGWRIVAIGDIDGDTKSDILWRRSSDGLLAYWIMDGPRIVRHGSIPVRSYWRIIAADDFNGDSMMDLVWNRAEGDMQYWHGDGDQFGRRQYFTRYPGGWELVGTADMNGDGRADLLWHNPSIHLLAYWVMNGPVIQRHGSARVERGSQFLAAGDFDGDGKDDLVWNLSTSDLQYWKGDGAELGSRQKLADYPRGWWLVPGVYEDK